MTKIRTLAIALTAVGSLAVGASNARAGGFLGDIINQAAPGVGTALDRLNHNLGNPVDHAAAAVANAYVPGSGTAMEAYWAAQRSGLLNQGPGFRAAPGGGGFQPAYQPAPMMAPALGNFCFTQGGRFGPGPAAPIGYPCQAFGWFGSVSQ